VTDTQYERLLSRALTTGTVKHDRTGVGTRSLFAQQLRYDLARGFPIVTTKKVHWRSVAVELLWMLRGDTNVLGLHEHGVTIWDEWAGPDGELGPVYGRQWRAWPTYTGGEVDQVQQVINTIRHDPDSRRQIVSAWNVGELPDMALPPCHLLWQTYVADGRLSLQVYQRSADLFLGVPFNVASYALLTHLLAAQTGLRPGMLTWVGGDCHLYLNHAAQAREQLTRSPFPFPRLTVDPADWIGDYTLDHLHLHNYRHHPAIRAEVAV
jgi:thymidylate synthase